MWSRLGDHVLLAPPFIVDDDAIDTIAAELRAVGATAATTFYDTGGSRLVSGGRDATVILVALGRQDDHREPGRRGLCPKPAENSESVELREIEIQQDKVGSRSLRASKLMEQAPR